MPWTPPLHWIWTTDAGVIGEKLIWAPFMLVAQKVSGKLICTTAPGVGVLLNRAPLKRADGGETPTLRATGLTDGDIMLALGS